MITSELKLRFVNQIDLQNLRVSTKQVKNNKGFVVWVFLLSLFLFFIKSKISLVKIFAQRMVRNFPEKNPYLKLKLFNNSHHQRTLYVLKSFFYQHFFVDFYWRSFPERFTRKCLTQAGQIQIEFHESTYRIGKNFFFSFFECKPVETGKNFASFLGVKTRKIKKI